MNKEIFIKELEKLGISLNDKQLDQLDKYADFLIQYNEHTNLTTITNKEEIYLKHFYDSLTITKAINMNEVGNLLDIGTGAGFPGMVIKIVFPKIKVSLLDSNNKKITFLKELSSLLNIEVELINNRAEEYIKNKRESFDIITTRAVANLNTLLELSIPYLKVNGYLIAMKSHAEEEIKNIDNALKELNSSVEGIIELNLPIEDSKRTIIKIKKDNKTNIKYPRRYDKIKKQPL